MRIVYEISPSGGEWALTRNREAGASYATAEGAFEVAVAQASIEMRSDHEILIRVIPAAAAARAEDAFDGAGANIG